MAKDKSNKYDFNSTDLVRFIWQRRVPVIIITLVAAIASAVVSLLIEEKYRSTVVLFPVSDAQISKYLMAGNYTGRSGILNFGEEEQVEQLLQVLQSDQIRRRVIDKFNLMDHYEIDSTATYPRTKLFNEYEANVNYKRTEYMSVVIEVLDKDPRIAADMANTISELVDTVYNSMKKERAYSALKLVEDEYFALWDQIRELEDSLKYLRSKGVIDPESQAQALTEAFGNALLEGKTRVVNNIDERLDILAKYGGPYVSIRDFLEFEKKQLSDLKAKYKEAKVEAEQNLPHRFIVDTAYEAEKKAYPKRSLIVVASTLSTFLLAVILMLLFDGIRRRI